MLPKGGGFDKSAALPNFGGPPNSAKVPAGRWWSGCPRCFLPNSTRLAQLQSALWRRRDSNGPPKLAPVRKGQAAVWNYNPETSLVLITS